MSSRDRRPYESATDLTQQVLNDSQDNLVQRLEMTADVEVPGTTLRLSDRAKYVGSTYYQPRVVFPNIKRTIGEWLANELEFSSLELPINNTDQAFSQYLPTGADYDGFIGRRITIKVGLAEIAASYRTIFTGVVTGVGGFKRDTSSFTLICRNDFDQVNKSVPNQALIDDDWPDIEDNFIGLGGPIIYGDWTTALRPEAPEVPAYPVNGLNAGVVAGTADVRCVISSVPLKSVDTSSVTLRRGEGYYTFASSDITIVAGSDNQVIDIAQGNLMIDATPWAYARGDEFLLKCEGVALANDDNIVNQAWEMLQRFGGLVSGDFDASWVTFINKSTPAESAITTFKSRVWLQEGTELLTYVLSMLEQVRLEAYVNRDNKWALSALHFDELVASPAYTVKNWDVARASFSPSVDDRNNFNRAKADFSFSPPSGENRLATPLYRNQAAVTQAGQEISKLLTFPNLYQLADVTTNLIEVLKLASTYSEQVDLKLTSRSVLIDLADFVECDVQIGSVEFDGVPCMVRSLSYEPNTMAIPATIWSFQMVPFDGYSPGHPGIVGGSTATITQET